MTVFSSGNIYTYVGTPTVTSVSPTFGQVAGGATVSIYGTFLNSVTSVAFGLTTISGGSITHISDGEIRVASPSAGLGAVHIRVTNIAGTSPESAADLFTYVSLAVTSLGQPSGPVAGGTTEAPGTGTITVNGIGFTAESTVSFGGTASTSVVFTSTTVLTVVPPPRAAGTVHVTVTSGAATSATSTADQYTYIALPVVTGIAPSAGGLDGGTRVLISGTGFVGATAVNFGATAGTDLAASPDGTELFVTAPAGTGAVHVTVVSPGGTSVTSSADLYTYRVNVLPTASFTMSPNSGNASLPVAFTSTSTDSDGTIVAQAWDFGDGAAVLAGPTPSHVYTVAGVYTVTLTVTDNDGGTDSSAQVIEVGANQLPVAAASATPAQGAAPLPVAFSSAGSSDPDGQPITYLWDFGDGTTSTLANPTHTYTVESETPYDVTLTVSDSSGGTDSANLQIQINANVPPVAVAVASVETGEALLAVAFDGSGSTDSDGTIVSYEWDFGDGTTRTTTAPVTNHTYTSGVGSPYEVSLTVTDNSGATHVDDHLVIVVTDDPNNTAPTAVISATPESGPAPLYVQFDGSGSTDLNGPGSADDGRLVRGSWYDDGELFSSIVNPYQEFTEVGDHVITLTVTDSKGLTGTATKTITVTESVIEEARIISMSKHSGSESGGTWITLTGVNFGFVTSYRFERTDPEANPQYYTGTMNTVRRLDGQNMVIQTPPGFGECDLVLYTFAGPSLKHYGTKYTYGPGPVAVADTVDGIHKQIPLGVFSFTSAGSSAGVTYLWEFGDGSLLNFGDANTSLDANPSHFYYSVGGYTVTLTVTDANGFTDTDTFRVFVTVPPEGGGFELPDPDDDGWTGGHSGPGGDGPGNPNWPWENPPGTPPGPVYLTASCTPYATHVPRNPGQKAGTPYPEPGLMTTESWKTTTAASYVQFDVTITALMDFDAYSIYLGGISMTADGGPAGNPIPTDSTAGAGYGTGGRATRNGALLSSRIVQGLFCPVIPGGKVLQGQVFRLTIRAPKTYAIAYASCGFLNLFGINVADSGVAYVKTDCDIKKSGWSVGFINVGVSVVSGGGIAVDPPPPVDPDDPDPPDEWDPGLPPDPVPVEPPVPEAPSTPYQFIAEASDGAVLLQWTRGGGGGIPTGFTLYRNTVNNIATATDAVFAASVTGVSVTGLTNNTKYWFWLKADNAVGSSSPATAAATPGVFSYSNIYVTELTEAYPAFAQRIALENPGYSTGIIDNGDMSIIGQRLISFTPPSTWVFGQLNPGWESIYGAPNGQGWRRPHRGSATITAAVMKMGDLPAGTALRIGGKLKLEITLLATDFGQPGTQWVVPYGQTPYDKIGVNPGPLFHQVNIRDNRYNLLAALKCNITANGGVLTAETTFTRTMATMFGGSLATVPIVNAAQEMIYEFVDVLSQSYFSSIDSICLKVPTVNP